MRSKILTWLQKTGKEGGDRVKKQVKPGSRLCEAGLPWWSTG